MGTTWLSSHGVAVSPAAAETHVSASSSTAVQALPVWQAFGNSDTFLPLSAQGSACHQSSSSLGARLWQKSQSPTTALLSQDPADPARLLGRAKTQL